MIIKNICGVLETFMEAAFSIGMFVELCGKERRRGGLAKAFAGMILAVYSATALLANVILLQSIPDMLYIRMPLLCLGLFLLIRDEYWRAVSWSVFVNGTILMLRLPVVLICAVVYGLSYSECVESNYQWADISILCMELVIFACCMRKRKVIGKFFNQMPFQKVFFSLSGVMETAIILYIINIDWESGYDIHSLVLMFILIILLFLITVSFVLLFEYEAVIRTNHILSANENRMQIYYDLLSKEIHQNRKKNHDRKYEYEYLYHCLEQKDYGNCLRFLREKSGANNVRTSVICTGYEMADYLIAKIVNQCRESNVEVRLNVEMHKPPIEGSEFFVLLANLLDNAVEAAVKCSDQRYIHITIHEMNRMFRMYIANSYMREPVKEGKRLVSGKKGDGNHGWGLESVKDTVKKYDGTIDITYGNKKFEVDIVFID